MSRRKNFHSDDEPLEVLPARKPVSLWLWAVGGAGMAALMGLAVVAGLTRDEHGRPAREHEERDTYDISTYASTMLVEYESNGVAADRDYKGKIVRVQGVVTAIDTDFAGKTYVALGTGREFEIIGVQCYFGRKHSDDLARLSRGQNVTIQGKCRGKPLNILLEDCQLVR